ncbi:MAG: ornithine carbamoyltransferase [Bryobacteraceae bacterium]
MAASVFKPASELRTPTFRHDLDLSTEQLLRLLELAGEVKRNRQQFTSALKGKYAALLFEKPSLRTRLTFELAMKQLGGDSVTQAGMIGEREPLKDVARNLARWTDCIVARTFEQKTIEDLALWSGIPVVNALSDTFHPCQALADMFTLHEQFAALKGLRLVFVGDGNNVAHSLMLCGARLGMHCTVATPPGYEPQAAVVEQATALAHETGGTIEITNGPEAAVRSANAVYTDVWASMGQEAEATRRKQLFARYQVNTKLMGLAASDAVFMHCLPAKRGLEVTDEVMESRQSVAFDQAENRLHAQKALLLTLLQ